MQLLTKYKKALYYISIIMLGLTPIIIFYISIPGALHKHISKSLIKPLKKTKPLSLYKQCIMPQFNITDIQSYEIEKEIKADTKQKLIDNIFTPLYKKNIINGNVLVAQKKILLYKKTFGYASLGNKEPLNENSQFQIASLSKTFTAVAILKLYENKLLSLEDPIAKYIPNFPYEGVTIKMLLSHRSGIPNYIYAFADKAKNATQRPSNADVIRWFIENKPKRYYLPDRKFSYNNTNYMILGRLIEIISHMPYEQYIKTNILDPLEMNNTVLPPNSPEKLSNPTYGHEGSRRIDVDFFDNIIGDKGIYTTTGDLYKWYQALQTDCLLKSTTLKNAFQVHSPEKKTSFNYGYGFRLLTDRHNNVLGIFHTGWWKGYNSLFYFDKKNEFTVIMLLNKRSHIVYNRTFLYTLFNQLQLYNTYHIPAKSKSKPRKKFINNKKTHKQHKKK